MAIPIQRLQRADRLLGGPVSTLAGPLRHLRRAPSAALKHILVVKFWGLGSLQLLTPSIRHLRERHPTAKVCLLTLSENRAFAEGLGVFDELVTLDVAGSWPALFERIVRLVARLRARRFDRVYDFEFLTRFSALVSLGTAAPETYGFSSPSTRRARLHTHSVPFNRYWHVAKNFLTLAGASDVAVGPEDLVPFRVTKEHRAETAAALFEAGFPDAGPLVVLNPNAGDLSLERRWPPDRFAELARRLVLEDNARIVVTGSSAERGRGHEVRARAGAVAAGRIANLGGRLSIGGLAALLESAEVFVTNDSGPMHVGAALGTPTIGLFGPETPQMYGPLGFRTHWLYRPPVCSPCINVHDNKLAVCSRGRAECLTNIEVDDVLDVVRVELTERVGRPFRTQGS